MNTLRSALEGLTATLQTTQTLADTIAMLERELECRLFARRVEIRYGATPPASVRPSELCVPLVLDGGPIGFALIAFGVHPCQADREVVQLLAAPIAAAIAWRANTGEHVRLHALVRTDALTGLANRMAFDERLNAAWRRCAQRETSLTLALLDIDYFKIYNDMYGHVTGDECLCIVSALLGEQAGKGFEFVARYGGEEFALISESVSSEAAIATVGAMLERLEARGVVHEGSTLGRVSMSAGIATIVPRGDRTIADFIREADRSLYRAKVLGRNRICTATHASGGEIASRNTRAIAAPPALEDATVGREADLARVTAALRQTRMITLVGPKGIGKSRLARMAGGAAAQFFTDGAVYVDFSLLSPDSDPVAALGSALDVTVESHDVLEALGEELRERSTLVILDDIDAVDRRRIMELCEGLLAAAPSIAIVATSRTALGCRDERVVVVAPLGDEASLELLRLRAGLGAAAETAALRRIAGFLGGAPARLEAAARHLVLYGPEETLGRLAGVSELPSDPSTLEEILLGSPLGA